MIGIVNGLLKALGAAISAILFLLPPSPFQTVSGLDVGWLKAINYVMPVTETIALLELYLVAVATYYAVRIILRWMKAASS